MTLPTNAEVEKQMHVLRATATLMRLKDGHLTPLRAAQHAASRKATLEEVEKLWEMHWQTNNERGFRESLLELREVAE